jgi:DNA topoisomerase-1
MRQTHARTAPLPASWKRLRRTRQAENRIRRKIATVSAALDPVASAEAAELRYVHDAVLPGIRRIGHGRRVRYIDPAGRSVASRNVLGRIRSLAIPPAWTDVWICPDPLGHLQATGRDARGRKQYRYHPRWREVRDEVKYGRLLAFASALPRIRARTAADLNTPGLSRNKVIATVVQLLEKTLIRVGNDEYARHNRSFGLTTLRNGHAKVNGTSVRFEFRGKSGVSHSVDLHDPRLTRIVRACRDLPGHELFQYVDANGQRQAVGSADVNQYVRDVTGQPFTSKDFRTWAGTVLVARALADFHGAARTRPTQRQIVRAVEVAADRLGNTAAVCRKCYIHPAVLAAYMEGRCIDVAARRSRSRRAGGALSADESAVVRLLEKRRPGAARR